MADSRDRWGRLDTAPERVAPARWAGRAHRVDRQADTAAGIVEGTAHTMADTLERADTLAAPRWARLHYMADMGHRVRGWRATALVLVLAEPLLSAAHPPETVSPGYRYCPAARRAGSVGRHRPRTAYHRGAWRSRSAGRMFHPKRFYPLHAQSLRLAALDRYVALSITERAPANVATDYIRREYSILLIRTLVRPGLASETPPGLSATLPGAGRARATILPNGDGGWHASGSGSPSPCRGGG